MGGGGGLTCRHFELQKEISDANSQFRAYHLRVPTVGHLSLKMEEDEHYRLTPLINFLPQARLSKQTREYMRHLFHLIIVVIDYENLFGRSVVLSSILAEKIASLTAKIISLFKKKYASRYLYSPTAKITPTSLSINR